MLDIDFVTETFPPEVNGVAMTVGHLVHGMRERGHRVSVLRPRQGKADAGSEHEIPLPGLPLPGYPGLRFGLPAGRQLARRWRQRRPDLVHVVTEGPLGWSAVSVARRLGIPVTSGFHTNFDRYSVHYGLGFLRPAVAAYLRTLHRRTRATMVPTAAMMPEEWRGTSRANWWAMLPAARMPHRSGGASRGSGTGELMAAVASVTPQA